MTMEKRQYNLNGLILAMILTELLFWGSIFPVYIYLKDNSENFLIENDSWFWLFLVIPVISLLFLSNIRWKNRAIAAFADSRLHSSLFPPTSTAKVVVKYILLRLSLGFLVIALANPQYGIKQRKAVTEGIEIMIALDVSNSMLTKDMKSANRLQIAKRAISKSILENLGGDQVGLVIFAGSAFKHTALTTDHNALMYNLDMVEPFMISNQGTNISNAINTCLTSFNTNSSTKKAIIIVSDGENHEQEAEGLAKTTFEKDGIRIYTIGMGTISGSRIPEYDKNRNLIGYKKDAQGNTVMSKLNENMLQAIAEAGGGKYVKADAADLGLDEIIKDINAIDKTKTGEAKYQDYSDQFMWFLAAAVILLIPVLLIQTDTLQRKQKIKLFEV